MSRSPANTLPAKLVDTIAWARARSWIGSTETGTCTVPVFVHVIKTFAGRYSSLQRFDHDCKWRTTS